MVIKLLLFLVFPWFLFAETATVSWEKNTENDLSGYKIYYGTSSGNYDDVLDVGNTTSFIINNLVVGTTYFFVVTAYDFSANESGFSDEVNITLTAGPDDIRKYRVAHINFPNGKVQPDNWSKDKHPVELLFNGEDIDWGNWNAGHTYSINFTAAVDTTITFQIFDTFYGDNSGDLEIDLGSTRILIPSDGQIVEVEVGSGTTVTITVSGTFNYWNSNTWANADAEYTQTSN